MESAIGKISKQWIFPNSPSPDVLTSSKIFFHSSQPEKNHFPINIYPSNAPSHVIQASRISSHNLFAIKFQVERNIKIVFFIF